MNDSPQPGGGFVQDLLSGTAAMLVAFPSAIAFGLLVYAGLGTEHAGRGALYGILGALALGIIAPIFGGRPGIVSAPCAPAAAVLAALVAALQGPSGQSPEQIVLILGLVTLGAAIVQFLIGLLGGGRLIKFIPYPVIAGYLSAVGLLIVGSQFPKLLALPAGTETTVGLTSPALWSWQALLVGGVTMAAMLAAPLVTKKVPAPIVGLALGILTYLGLSVADPALRVVENNALVIGPLGGEGAFSVSSLLSRFSAVGELGAEQLTAAVVPGFTLAVLLSIDTLKTGVLVDALTRTRHDSDRELRAQGLGNAASALLGGMAGAGTAGPTLVNVSSGGRTRRSGLMAGLMSLAAFALLGRLVAWVPVSALAGILVVVGVKMVDRRTFDLLGRRSTIFDFVVVAAVVATALIGGLITAALVGLALAILLFVRDQARGSVVRRTLSGRGVFSKTRRLPSQRAVLKEFGEQTLLCELQGNLFFGTTDQLFSELEPQLADRRYVILDMHLVRSLDFTAGRMLHQIGEQLNEKGGTLVFAALTPDLRPYLAHFDVLMPTGPAPSLADTDEALGWAENRILEREGALRSPREPPYSLEQINLLEGLSATSLEMLAGCVEEIRLEPNERLFAMGDEGDSLYMIRKGTIRIVLPLEGGTFKHLATFARGDFFGDMAFLEPGPRSADAVAASVVELFALSLSAFKDVAATQPEVDHAVYSRLARALARHLRDTNDELRVLGEA